MGREKGLHVLPGSDPLPFPAETGKVGSYGFHLEGRPDEMQPFGWLRKVLRADPPCMQPYGQRERLPRFIKNQFAMQVHKRFA